MPSAVPGRLGPDLAHVRSAGPGVALASTLPIAHRHRDGARMHGLVRAVAADRTIGVRPGRRRRVAAGRRAAVRGEGPRVRERVPVRIARLDRVGRGRLRLVDLLVDLLLLRLELLLRRRLRERVVELLDGLVVHLAWIELRGVAHSDLLGPPRDAHVRPKLFATPRGVTLRRDRTRSRHRDCYPNDPREPRAAPGDDGHEPPRGHPRATCSRPKHRPIAGDRV